MEYLLSDQCVTNCCMILWARLVRQPLSVQRKRVLEMEEYQ